MYSQTKVFYLLVNGISYNQTKFHQIQIKRINKFKYFKCTNLNGYINISFDQICYGIKLARGSYAGGTFTLQNICLAMDQFILFESNSYTSIVNE